jgi:hypothetical protein
MGRRPISGSPDVLPACTDPGARGPHHRAVKRVYLAAVVVLALLGALAGTVAARAHGRPLVAVRGVIGSEKGAFFADPAVRRVFATHGLRLDLDPRGSRQMATTVDLSRYDFAFPSSEPAARAVQQRRGVSAGFHPFASPLAVATFTPIVDLLAAQGVVRRTPAGYWALDMRAYLDAAARGLRWDQIPGNVAYPARRAVLLTTTAPDQSNSAALYAAIADRLINDPARVAALFADQGALESTTEAPFDSYVSRGLSYAPLVLVYEAQYIGLAYAGQLPPDRVLIYLSPTVRSGHALVPLTAKGDRVGRLLAGDRELARLAARHGFRTADPAVFAPVLAKVSTGGAALPGTVDDVVDPPSFEALDTLLRDVAQRLGQ